MKIVTEADFLISDWSGGKTNKVFISQEGASLAGRVNQFELARFSGSWPTKGKGKLTDFNLIFKPSYHPKVQISYFKEETRARLEETTMVLYLLTGSVGINDQLIQAPVLILNNEHQKIEITYFAESRVIFIEMNLVG